MTRFCAENLHTLKNKKLGLFICGMAEGDNAQRQLEASFPKELLSAAVARESFGGGYDLHQMNFLESFIMRKISGSDENRSRIMEENMTRFAGQMDGM